MSMKEISIQDFVSNTGSKDPVPGGGSVSALTGALAGALAQMVASLTMGKDGYEDVEEEMKELSEKSQILRTQLIDDIQRDADSFNKFMEALSMAKETEYEKDIRMQAMQEGLKEAAIVPYEIANRAYSIMELSEIAVEKGNKNAVTDGLISGMMARTAVLSALLNTKVNLKSIKDEDFVGEYTDKVRKLEIKAIDYEKKILSNFELN